MSKKFATIVGAVVGGALGFLLYAVLVNTGHIPLGGADQMESGRDLTPYLFAVYGTIAGAIVGYLTTVRRWRQAPPEDRNWMAR